MSFLPGLLAGALSIGRALLPIAGGALLSAGQKYIPKVVDSISNTLTNKITGNPANTGIPARTASMRPLNHTMSITSNHQPVAHGAGSQVPNFIPNQTPSLGGSASQPVIIKHRTYKKTSGKSKSKGKGKRKSRTRRSQHMILESNPLIA